MNIREALERVRDLRQHIEAIRALLNEGDSPNSETLIRINVGHEGAVTCPVITREQCLELLRKQLEADQAELDRLQPIINMANLALKGLST